MAAAAAASGGVLGTPIAPFGKPPPPAGARCGGGAFDSGPGGASEPHGTAGFAWGLTAGKSAWAAFAAAPATGALTPSIVALSLFATGAGGSIGAPPSSVFLNVPAPLVAALAGTAAGGFAAPNADAAPAVAAEGFASVAAGFANAEPAALNGDAGAGLGGVGDGDAGAAITLPSFAITKLVLHFGQRIFMPEAGIRRSSTSYGDLHDTHSTLIMDDRTALLTPRILRDALRRDETPNGCTLHGQRISRDT